MTTDFSTHVHQAFQGTTLLDVILLVLAQPEGRGIVNELAHEGPYRFGPLEGFQQTRIETEVLCPYCEVPVLRYEYPQIGVCVFICHEIGLFTRLPIGEMKLDNWRRLVRETATTWTRIEADRNSGKN